MSATWRARPGASARPFTTWHGDDPSQTAYAYYDAGPTDIAGKTWFRPSFLYELLHAFGFNHTLTRYSFMNHRGNGGFPWANREPDDAVRPLPDEIATLRRLYHPASDSRYDVAALNTWYAPPGDPDDDAAWQSSCAPRASARRGVRRPRTAPAA